MVAAPDGLDWAPSELGYDVGPGVAVTPTQRVWLGAQGAVAAR